MYRSTPTTVGDLHAKRKRGTAIYDIREVE